MVRRGGLVLFFVLIFSSILVVVACGGPRSARGDLGTGWQSLSDTLGLETGLAVFANAFSCGLTAAELRRLHEIGASRSQVVLVLLANPADSTSVTAFGRDMGFSSHRTMTHSRFRSMVGADHVPPLFVVFKRGRPAVIVNSMTSRALDALDVFF